VVRPTYFLASGVFVDHGARVLEVPADDTGLDLRALEALLLSGVRPRLLYIVPTHANPTGCTLPAASRAALVRLAARYSFFIICDEVYHQLSWGAPVPARLRAFDVGGDGDAAFDGEDRPLAAPGSVAQPQPTPGSLVISVSSFTKTLAPGLRLGWVEASAAVLARLAARSYLVSGGGVAPFASLVVLEALLSGGQDAHLARLTAAYARRCAVLCDALSAAAGDAGWSFVQPQGGYFVWLRLPADVAADALLAAAKARGVAVLPGARCCGVAEQAAHTGGVADAPQHVRLCFAFLEDDALREGVRRLATAVADARCCELPRPAV
jgi:2-aminoadipate transaminase